MITSLNVNHFVGKENWLELQGNNTTKINIWNGQKDYYFNYIKNHLISDDDVVILHEVPYIKESPYINKHGETKYKILIPSETDNLERIAASEIVQVFYEATGVRLEEVLDNEMTTTDV